MTIRTLKSTLFLFILLYHVIIYRLVFGKGCMRIHIQQIGGLCSNLVACKTIVSSKKGMKDESIVRRCRKDCKMWCSIYDDRAVLTVRCDAQSYCKL